LFRELPPLSLRASRYPASIEGRSSWVAASVSLAILSISSGAPLVVVVGLKPIAASLGVALQIGQDHGRLDLGEDTFEKRFQNALRVIELRRVRKHHVAGYIGDQQKALLRESSL